MFVLDVVTPAWFEYVKPFLEVLIPIVASAVGVFLTILLKRACVVWHRKTGHAIDEKKQERIKHALLGGIALAEQVALKASKQKKDAPESAVKLKIAVGYAHEALRDMGYGEVPLEKIEEWVEILLAQFGEDNEDPKAFINRLYPAPMGSQFFLTAKEEKP